MEESYIDRLLLEFQESLDTSATQNHYIPKIRDYFIPYINENYDISSEKKLKKVLRIDVNTEDLIESAVRYLNKETVNSITEIDSYIGAFNGFFKFLYNNGWENTNIVRMKMEDETVELAGIIRKAYEAEDKILREKMQHPVIEKRQARFLINYCDKIYKDYIPKRNVNDMRISDFLGLQKSIIISLLLLYGIRPKKLFDIRTNMFDVEYGTLKVIGKDKVYVIELPQGLADKMRLLISEQEKWWKRDRQVKRNKERLLFVNAKGNKEKETFITDILVFAQEQCLEKYSISTNMTPTGLIKYAICNMIKEDMNKDIIEDFTGYSDVIYDACVATIKKTRTYESDYLNEKFKRINTVK